MLEKSGKSGRHKPSRRGQVRTARTKLHFEALEKRVLLSADLNPLLDPSAVPAADELLLTGTAITAALEPGGEAGAAGGPAPPGPEVGAEGPPGNTAATADPVPPRDGAVSAAHEAAAVQPPVPPAANPGGTTGNELHAGPAPETAAPAAPQQDAAALAAMLRQQAPREIVFVDPSVENFAVLLAEIFAGPREEEAGSVLESGHPAQGPIAAGASGAVASPDQAERQTDPLSDAQVSPPEIAADSAAAIPRDVRVIVLDGTRDGVDQISEFLESYQGIAALHLLSHGSTASVRLGTAQLSGSTLKRYGDQLKAWGRALAPSGDILLYGCNVARGEAGIEFVERLGSLTDADIAASTDDTGGAAAGGDWILEGHTGVIEAEALFAGAQDYAFLLAEVAVTGDGKPDTFDIRQSDVQRTGATAENVAFQPADSLVLNGRAGDDKFIVHAVPKAASLTVDGGTGARDILDLSNLAQNLTLSLSAAKRFTVKDAANTTILDDTVNIDEIVLTKNRSNTLDLSGLQDAQRPVTFTVVADDVVEVKYDGLAFKVVNVEALKGGAGDDTFIVKPGAQLSGRIDGGGGRNTLSFTSDPLDIDNSTGYGAPMAVDLALGRVPNINGGQNDGIRNIQVFIAGAKDDPITAAQGFTVHGGAGRDEITGTALDDPALFGDKGDDTIWGLGGIDRIDGGAGNDTIYGGMGNDVLDGGADNDTFVFEAGWGTDVIDEKGGGGTDTLDLTRIDADVTVTIKKSGAGADAGVSLAAGADRIAPARFVETLQLGDFARSYAVTVHGDWAEGLQDQGNSAVRSFTIETLRQEGDRKVPGWLGANTAVTLDFSAVTKDLLFEIGPGTLTVTDVPPEGSGATVNRLVVRAENIVLLTGGQGNNTYKVLSNGALTGQVIGGAANQLAGKRNALDYSEYPRTPAFAITQVGDFAQNRVEGIYGGLAGAFKGINYFIGSRLDDRLVVDDIQAQIGLDGGPGNDTLDGSAGNDRLFGGTGSDVLYGDGGTDALSGGAGADTLYGGDNAPGPELELISGGAGNDLLFGEGGNDLLLGGADHDRLDGGAGDDILKGGPGDDTYLFGGDWGIDQVFESDNGGRDTLDFSGALDAMVHIFTGGQLLSTTSPVSYGTPADFAVKKWADGTVYYPAPVDGNQVLVEKSRNQNEVQRIDLGDASTGRFTLSYENRPTGPIAYDPDGDALAGLIEAALNALLGPARAVSVKAGGFGSNSFDVEFTRPAFTDVTPLLITSIDLKNPGGGAAAGLRVDTLKQGRAVNEVQLVTVTQGSAGETFTLKLGDDTTEAIVFAQDDQVTAGDIKRKLEALSGWKSKLPDALQRFTDAYEVTVEVAGEHAWRVIFNRPVDTDIDTLSVTTSGIANTTVAGSVQTLRDGQAPSGVEHIEKIVAADADNTFAFGNDWGLKNSSLSNWSGLPDPDYLTAWLNEDRKLEIDTAAMLDPARHDVSLITVAEALDPAAGYRRVEFDFQVSGYDAGHDDFYFAYDLRGLIDVNDQISLVPAAGGAPLTFTVEAIAYDDTTRRTQLTVRQPIASDDEGYALTIERAIANVSVEADDRIGVLGDRAAYFAHGDTVTLIALGGQALGDYTLSRGPAVAAGQTTLTVAGDISAAHAQAAGVAGAARHAGSVAAGSPTRIDLADSPSLGGATFQVGHKVALLDGAGNAAVHTVAGFIYNTQNPALGHTLVLEEAIAAAGGVTIAHYADIDRLETNDRITLATAQDPTAILKPGHRVTLNGVELRIGALSAYQAGAVTITTQANIDKANDLAAVAAATSFVRSLELNAIDRGGDVMTIAGDSARFFLAGTTFEIILPGAAGAAAKTLRFDVGVDAVFAAGLTTVTVEQAIDDDLNGADFIRAYDVTAVNDGGDRVRVAGNQAALFTPGVRLVIEGGGAQVFTVTGSAVEGLSTWVTVREGIAAGVQGGIARAFAIAVAAPDTRRFGIQGDWTNRIAPGAEFSVAQSTGNDGRYKVGGVAYDADLGVTRITIDITPGAGFHGAIASAKADGVLYLRQELAPITASDNGHDVLHVRGSLADAVAGLLATAAGQPVQLRVVDAQNAATALRVAPEAQFAPRYIAPNTLVLDFRNVSQRLEFEFATRDGVTSLKVGRKAELPISGDVLQFGALFDVVSKLLAPDKDFAEITFTSVDRHTVIYGGGDHNTISFKSGAEYQGSFIGSNGLRNPREILADALAHPQDAINLLFPSATVTNEIDYSSAITRDTLLKGRFGDLVNFANMGDSYVYGLGKGKGPSFAGITGTKGLTGKVSGITDFTFGPGFNLLLGAGVGSATDLIHPTTWVKDLLGEVFWGRNHFTVGGIDWEIDNEGATGATKFLTDAWNRLAAGQLQTWSPGLHILAGKGGADTYSFGGVWGVGVVIENPDLVLGPPGGSGAAAPEGFDTLDFQEVTGDLHFTIYEVTTENIASFRNIFSSYQGRIGDGTGSSHLIDIGTNIVVVSDSVYNIDTDSAPSAPFATGLNFVIANDIENIIGGQGVNTFSFIDGAQLQGIVTTATGGEVVLDYREYRNPGDSRGVSTDLGVLERSILGPIADLFGFGPTEGIVLGYGTADGIIGGRLGGFDTLINEWFNVDLPFDDWAVSNVTRVIGSSGNDNLTGNAKRDNTFVLTSGGIDQVDGRGVPAGGVGNTVSYEGATAGVVVDLTIVASKIPVPTYQATSANGSAWLSNIQNIEGGKGNDRLAGDATKNIYFFKDGWGTDIVYTNDASPGLDRLDFGKVTKQVTNKGAINGPVTVNGQTLTNAVLYETADGLNKVYVVGAYDAAATDEASNLNPAQQDQRWLHYIAPVFAPLRVALGNGAFGADLAALSAVQLDALASEAIQRWLDAAGGASLPVLADIVFQIADLAGGTLGLAGDHTVYIDADAGGAGWFVDPTPADDSEYLPGADGALAARDGGIAVDGVDLLTAIMHELGHLLGLGHADGANTLMGGTLAAGTRINPTPEDGARALLGGAPVDGARVQLDQAQQRSISDGLSAFAPWANDFQIELDDIFGPEIPFTDQTLADLFGLTGLDIGAEIDAFRAAFMPLFGDGSVDVTDQDLLDAGLDVGIVAQGAGRTQFQARIDLVDPLDQILRIDIGSISLPTDFLGLDLDLGAFGLTGEFPDFRLSGGITLTMDFGLDEAGAFFLASPGIRGDVSFGGRPLAVIAVNTAGHGITVGGDQRAVFTAGEQLAVEGSDGNDGMYIIAGVTYAADGQGGPGTTTIHFANPFANNAPGQLGEAVTEQGDRVAVATYVATRDSFTFRGALPAEYSGVNARGTFLIGGSEGNNGAYTIARTELDGAGNTIVYVDQEIVQDSATGHFRPTFDAAISLGPLALGVADAVLGFDAGIFVGTEGRLTLANLTEGDPAHRALAALAVQKGLRPDSSYDILLPLEVTTPLSGLVVEPVVLAASSSLGLPSASNLLQFFANMAYLFPSTLDITNLVRFNGFSLDDLLNVIDYALDELAGERIDDPDTQSDEQGLIYKDMPLVSRSAAEILATDWNAAVSQAAAQVVDGGGNAVAGLHIFHNGSGGEFTLSANGSKTLAFDATRQDLQQALVSLGLAATVLRGDGTREKPWEITGISDVTTLVVDDSALTTDFITLLRDTFKKVRAAVTDLSAFEAEVNQELKALLYPNDPGRADPLTLAYVDSSFIFDLSLGASFASTLDLSVDLGSYLEEYVTLPLDLDIASQAKVDVLGYADLDLGFAFDLSNVGNPALYFDDTTGLSFGLDVINNGPLAFKTAINVLGIDVGLYVDNGSGHVSFAGRAGLADDSADDSRYTLSELRDAFEFDFSGDVALDLPFYFPTASMPLGGFAADLDGDGIGENVLHYSAAIDESGFIYQKTAVPSLVPSFDLFAILNDPKLVLTGLEGMFDKLKAGMQARFETVGLPLIGAKLNEAAGFVDKVRNTLLNIADPNVALDMADTGTALASLPRYAVGLGSFLLEAYIDGRSTVESLLDLIGNELYRTLGEPGLNILRVQQTDPQGRPLFDGLGNPLVVDVTDPGQIQLRITGSEFQFNVLLADNIFRERIPLSFDASAPGLGLSLKAGEDSNLDFTLDYTFGLGFGFNNDLGLYLDTSGATAAGEEFALTAAASLSAGAELQARLGFLQGTVRELADADGPSRLAGKVAIDLDGGADGRWDIGGETLEVIARVNASANADFSINVNIASDALSLPEITTLLHYDQVFADIEISSRTGTSVQIGGSPDVVFEDVTLDLGKAISGFVGPIVDKVGDILAPIKPLIDLLYMEVDLGVAKLRMLDLARLRLTAKQFANVEKAIEAISSVIDLIDAVNQASKDSLIINFGSFHVGGDMLKASTPEAKAATEVPEGAGARPDLEGATGSNASQRQVVKQFGTTKGSFQFPLLQNPASAFGLLMGKDVDLFIYKMPALVLNFEYVQSFPIYPGLNGRIGGRVTAMTDFSFGFDTFGFNQWSQANFALNDVDRIFEGFYVVDKVNGVEVVEATITAALIAGASIGIGGLVEAGVDGGLQAAIEFDLNDKPDPDGSPTGDGKMRVNEILDRLAESPLCLFDMRGELRAFLEAFFWIGFKIFGAEITIFEARDRFVNAVLAKFDYTCPPPDSPDIAQLDNGVLTLRYHDDSDPTNIANDEGFGAHNYAVERAAQVDLKALYRSVDLELLTRGTDYNDNKELLRDKNGRDLTALSGPVIIVKSRGLVEVYREDEISRIQAFGTNVATADSKKPADEWVSDTYVIGEGINAQIVLHGKGGSDRFEVRSGMDRGGESGVQLFGEAGDDRLTVFGTVTAHIRMDGGTGKDELAIRLEDNATAQYIEAILIGGSGKDSLLGSDGRDILYGDLEEDRTQSGDANAGLDPALDHTDVLVGGKGNDDLYGGWGDDLLQGKEGADRLYGGAGKDRLEGGSASDELYGEAGEDILIGGTGDDLIDGGTGADFITWRYGDGSDTVYGGDSFYDDDGVTQADRDRMEMTGADGEVIDIADLTLGAPDRGDGNYRQVVVAYRVANRTETLTLEELEELALDLGEGADTVTVADLRTAELRNIEFDLGTGEVLTPYVIRETRVDELATVSDSDPVLGEFDQVFVARQQVFQQGDPRAADELVLQQFHRYALAKGDHLFNSDGTPQLKTELIDGAKYVIQAFAGEKAQDANGDDILIAVETRGRDIGGQHVVRMQQGHDVDPLPERQGVEAAFYRYVLDEGYHLYDGAGRPLLQLITIGGAAYQVQRHSSAAVIATDMGGNLILEAAETRFAKDSRRFEKPLLVRNAAGDMVEATRDANGDLVPAGPGDLVEREIFIDPVYGLDSQRDRVILYGGEDADQFFLSTAIDDQDAEKRPTLSVTHFVSDTDSLNFSIKQANAADDRLHIITLGGHDRVFAADIEHDVLDELRIETGTGEDVVVGSRFAEVIDTGPGNDRVTGGRGVDMFIDAGGFDTLIETRDGNFFLSDAAFIVEELGAGRVTGSDERGFPVVARDVLWVEAEALDGIFEQAILAALDPAADPQGVIDPGEAELWINRMTVESWTGDVELRGGEGSDVYDITLSGGRDSAGESYVEVLDTGDAGIDRVVINGTIDNDLIHFDAQYIERLLLKGDDDIFLRLTDLTTEIKVRDVERLPIQLRQKVRYNGAEEAEVRGRAGHDVFIADDSNSSLHVYGDSGDDSFYIGNVISTRTVSDPDYGQIEVVDQVTRGVSFRGDFHGGTGDDYFEVNHNQSQLFLYGDEDDDTFVIKALLTAADNDINVDSGGGANDSLAYVKNAPVHIFGGSGFDTVAVIGTEAADTFYIFVEEEDGVPVQRIYGAGLIVPTIDSIERLLLITGGGNDTVYLYGTLDGQEISIDTGRGDDTIYVGGRSVDFEVLIPQSTYTVYKEVPQPSKFVTEDVLVAAAHYVKRQQYYSIFGIRLWSFTWYEYVPAVYEQRVTEIPQPPAIVPIRATVPEYRAPVHLPETRHLEGIRGPLTISGGSGEGDRIIVDNTFGALAGTEGTLEAKTIETVGLNDRALVLGMTTDAARIDMTPLDAVFDRAHVARAVDELLARDRQMSGDGPGTLFDAVRNLTGAETRAATLSAGTLIRTLTGAEAGNGFYVDGLRAAGYEVQLAADASRGYVFIQADTGVTLQAGYLLQDAVESQLVDAVADGTPLINHDFTIGALDLGYTDPRLLTLAINTKIKRLHKIQDPGLAERLVAGEAYRLDLPMGTLVQLYEFGAVGTARLDQLAAMGYLVKADPDTGETRVYTGADVTVELAPGYLDAYEKIRSKDYDTVSGLGTAYGVYYENTEHLEARLSNHDDQFTVHETGAITRIFGNGGNDAIRLVTTDGLHPVTIFGDTAPDYAEDFRGHAAELGQLLGLGSSFDESDRRHVQELMRRLSAEFAQIDIAADSVEFVSNFRLDDYNQAIMAMIRSHVNTIDDVGYYLEEPARLGQLLGLGVAYDKYTLAHKIALAQRLNARYAEVDIDTAAIDEATLDQLLEEYNDLTWTLLKERYNTIQPGQHYSAWLGRLKIDQGELLILRDGETAPAGARAFVAGQIEDQRALVAQLVHDFDFVLRPEDVFLVPAEHITVSETRTAAFSLPIFDFSVRPFAVRYTDISYDYPVSFTQVNPIYLDDYRAQIWQLLRGAGLARDPFGDDTVTISDSGATLGAIQGRVEFHGQQGRDHLHLVGSGGSGAETLTLSAEGVTGLGEIQGLGLRAGVFYGLATEDRLTIEAGSGDGVVNVRDTHAETHLLLHAGDERVYVSSQAALTALTDTDLLSGHLDGIRGDLHLDLGDGRHKLLVSDEASAVGDDDVVLTASLIGGLARGDIRYAASAQGSLADGITIWSGRGSDVIAVSGADRRAGMRTVTTLNTNSGDDRVTVDLHAAVDGFFVLNTEGGNDTVNAARSSLPLIVFGGAGADRIVTGSGDDIVFGDRGRVDYLDGGQLLARLGGGGPGDLSDGAVRPADRMYTVDGTTGGDDAIDAGDGANVVFGGNGSDTIDTGNGYDIIVADLGEVLAAAGAVYEIRSLEGTVGGNDRVRSGAGDDYVLGGVGADAIDGAGGDDALVGDNGEFYFERPGDRVIQQLGAPASAADGARARLANHMRTVLGATGGDDVIDAGDGANVVFGGNGSDTIDTGNGSDIIVADLGEVLAAAGAVYRVGPLDNAVGGDDRVSAGDGTDYVLGGVGADDIAGGGGDDALAGDNGEFYFLRLGEQVILQPGNRVITGDGIPATLDVFWSIDPSLGGNDLIHGDDGDDVLIGGAGDDALYGGNGDDILLGDGGSVIYFAGRPVQIETSHHFIGGPDLLDGGPGHDLLFGGFGADALHGDLAEDVLIGDYGRIVIRDGRIEGILRLGQGDLDLLASTMWQLYAPADPNTIVLTRLGVAMPGSAPVSPAELAAPRAGAEAAALAAHGAAGPDLDVLPAPGAIAPRIVTHTVAAGDSLWRIAQRYLGDGARWPEIWRANPQIVNPDLIYPGQAVRLPGKWSAHTVREGDTLSGLAQRYLGDGARWAEIWRVNPQIVDPDVIFPGAEVIVPAAPPPEAPAPSDSAIPAAGAAVAGIAGLAGRPGVASLRRPGRRPIPEGVFILDAGSGELRPYYASGAEVCGVIDALDEPPSPLGADPEALGAAAGAPTIDWQGRYAADDLIAARRQGRGGRPSGGVLIH